MMFCVFHNMGDRETKRVTMEVRDIVSRYNIPVFKRDEPSPGKDTSLDVKVDEFGTMYCKYCGSEIKSKDIVYCEACGSKLK